MHEEQISSLLKYTLWPTLWLFYFLLLLNVDMEFGLVQASVFVMAQAITVHINEKYLLPHYYKNGYREKHIVNGLMLVFVISIVSTGIDKVLIHAFAASPRHPEHNEIAQVLLPLFLHFSINGFAFLASTAVSLNKKAQEDQVRIKELERAQTDTELRFLKTQINPHFLFNALNNIYTISYMGEKEAPDKILELSEMLRYVLYDCKGDSVPLEKELAYIRNYIDFQQLKTEKNQNIRLTVADIKSSVQIAPMLLIPFVENSFKHSKIDKETDAFVTIDISKTEDELLIVFRNSKPKVEASKWLNSEGGIGLENVQKRLDLLYPQKHELKIENGELEFCVTLRIFS